MKYVKTHEGFFDFLKKKESEDDKITQIYIDRLESVDGISPYSIDYSELNVLDNNDDAKVYKYKINFHDTPIYIMRGKIVNPSFNRFTPEVNTKLKNEGAIFKSSSEFFQLYLPHQTSNVKGSYQKLEELFELTEKVYKEDIEAVRIKKIRDDINTSEGYEILKHIQ